MVIIHIEKIIEVLEKLLSGEISKEDAANWAYGLTVHDDHRNLEYYPSKAKDIIWSGIGFIQGIDLKVSHEEYLHDDENIKQCLKNIGDRLCELNIL